MSTVKVRNLSGGLYRTKTPEEIPEISFYDLVNFDIENKAILTRDGYEKLNTSGLQAGCLQFGYSATHKPHLKTVSGGDYSVEATTNSKWTMSFYLKGLAGSAGGAPIDLRGYDSSGNVTAWLLVQYTAASTLRCRVRSASTESFTNIDTSVTISSAVTHAYAVVITPVTTTNYQVQVYNYSGNIGSTTISATASWQNFSYIGLGSNIYGYIGELAFTKNESIGDSLVTSRNIAPPCHECATANRIAYYPLRKDFKDAWGLNPTFQNSPTFETGSGLFQYQVDDPTLTSPQLTSMLFSSKSARINSYRKIDHVNGATPTNTATTWCAYWNPESGGYTISFPIVPDKIGSSSTTLTILSTLPTSPFAGFEIGLKYASAENATIAWEQDTDGGTSKKLLTTTIPMRRKSFLMFDYAKSGTTMTQSIYRDFGLVATTQTTVASAVQVPARMHYLRSFSAGSSLKNYDLYLGSILMHNTQVATSWTQKPLATARRVTSYETTTRWMVTGYGYDPERGGHIKIKELVTTQTETTTQENDTASPYNQLRIPSFANVKGMYLFSEFSGFDHASTTSDEGRLINYIDTGNAQWTAIEMSKNQEPIWIADRNSVGLTSTGYLDDSYLDEFDSAFSYVPANANFGKKLLLSNNTSLIDTSGNTYAFTSTYKYGRRGRSKLRGFMYANYLYMFNEDYFMRYDGSSVNMLEVPSPNIRLGLTAVTDGSGLYGAYGYTYTYKNKVGVESYPALPISTTIRNGKVRVTLDPQLTDSSFVDDSVESVVLYRTKGNADTAVTTLVNNNGTFFYELATMPIETVRDAVGTTLFTDKVSDSALGKQLVVGYNDTIPPCKYGSIYQKSGVYTGDVKSPNHYYWSIPEAPEVLEGYGAFVTEDGQPNVAIVGLGTGFIVFKRNMRRYVRLAPGEIVKEYSGGCMANDSLAVVGDKVFGLGESGFFVSNGYDYRDITQQQSRDGRSVSDIQDDVDGWSDAVKEAAIAVYHPATSRYICYVNDKLYVYHTKRGVWRKYEDFVGIPIVYDGDFYIYRKGWVWKEISTQAYVNTGAFIDDVVAGTTGSVQVVSTTALPTTGESGLPVYVDNEQTWVTDITASGTTYTIQTESNTVFSSSNKKVRIGVMEARAETRAWNGDTPSRNLRFRRFMLNHDVVAGGEIYLRYVRRGETMDDAYDHYVFDTDKDKGKTWIDARDEAIRFKFGVMDGKAHQINGYTVEYDQEAYGI